MIIQTGGELVDCLRAEGPETTLLYLHNSYDRILYNNSIKYLKPPCQNRLEHSLDVKQETWLAVFRDLEGFLANPRQRDYTNPLGWLLIINFNKCLQHLSSYQKFGRVISLEENEMIKDENSDPLRDLLQKERREILQTAFSTLTEREQKVVKLFSEGVPHKVIAALLEISPTLSRQILCRTLGKLKEVQGGNIL